jgi:hypothetical protein
MGYISSGRLRRETTLLVVPRAGLLYSEAVSYSTGNLSVVETLASMSYSYERISLRGSYSSGYASLSKS